MDIIMKYMTTLQGILMVLVCVDYITGIATACVMGTVSSSVGCKGIYKKVYLFVLIGICYVLDKFLGLNAGVTNIVTMLFIANECISIVENGHSIGVPIPDIIINTLDKIKDETIDTE